LACHRHTLLLAAALLGAGCTHPNTPPRATFAIKPAGQVLGVAASQLHGVATTAALGALPSTNAGPAQLPAVDMGPASTAKGETLHLKGTFKLPSSVLGLANARDGLVMGAPVTVYDVSSGKRIGQGVTYYDGSYDAQVPVSVGKRAAMVSAKLVASGSLRELFPLNAVVMLAPELLTQTVKVDANTTAWYALMLSLAAQQMNAPKPDWTHLVPGQTALALAQMVASSQPLARDNFLAFAGSTGGIGMPTSGVGLQTAIDGFVGHLVATATPSQP
jgi:hypothetical protein